MPILRVGKPFPRPVVRRALRSAAIKYGLRPDFLEAIGKVETDWQSNLVNQTGPDAKRGGAWGVTQITERTARAHKYEGPMAALLYDPELAAEWTARILSDAHPTTLADYVAAWNAGRYDADRDDDNDLDELPQGHPTREHYLPRAVEALSYVQKHPAGVEGWRDVGASKVV